MPQNDEHIIEFSRRAKSYQENNFLQKQIAKELISNIKNHPKTILDLGCGSGEIYNLIDWKIDKFIALDRSKEMCKLHPKDKKISVICEDFDNFEIYKKIDRVDLITASSSIQWSNDIYNLVGTLTSHTNSIAFAIFCDKTFKTLYQISRLNSFLPNSKKLLDHLNKLYDLNSKIVEYQLRFDDNLSIFRYIKKSGVSGGNRQLNYKETKELIKKYPLNYLEFEVLFVWGEPK